MGFREDVLNAQTYLGAESARLASPQDTPPTTPTLTSLRGVTLNADGTANVTIEQGHGARVIDWPIVLFCVLAMHFGCRLRLNSRGSNKAAGDANLYPRLDAPRSANKPRLNMQLNRIVGDPKPGWTVRENPTDHRNHLREGLCIESSPAEYGPGKSRTTRLDIVEAILGAFDNAIPATRPVVTRDELGALLFGLLWLSDQRSAERAMMMKEKA